MPGNDLGPPESEVPAHSGTGTATTATVDSAESSAAKRLDHRIRLLAGSIGDSLAKLHMLVEEAKQGEIHKALGFPSWTAYLADALTIQVQLGREQRRELVGYLSGEGMSQRTIADIVRVDQKTVSNDLRSTAEEFSSPENVVPITGRDNKDYPRRRPDPKPRPTNACPDCGADRPSWLGGNHKCQASMPRRKPITAAFSEASYNLTKATNRLQRLAVDDRFTRNRNELGRNASDLIRARDAITSVLALMQADPADMLDGGE